MTPRHESLSLRLSPSTRRRIERIAQREGISPPAAAARLLELGLAQAEARSTLPVPSLADFRAVRAELSRSLEGRSARAATPR